MASSIDLRNGEPVIVEWRETISDVDWVKLSDLYAIAPLGTKSPADLETVFRNSRFFCLAYKGEQIIGVGRALADGVDCSYICDVAVHPDFQGAGVGKQIVGRLVEKSKAHKKIILYAVPGKESFYRTLGFRKMATAMAIFSDPEDAQVKGYIVD